MANIILVVVQKCFTWPYLMNQRSTVYIPFHNISRVISRNDIQYAHLLKIENYISNLGLSIQIFSFCIITFNPMF